MTKFQILFFKTKKKKTLLQSFLKIVAIENSKRKKLSKNELKLEEQKTEVVNKEVKRKVDKIRKTKKQSKLTKLENKTQSKTKDWRPCEANR